MNQSVGMIKPNKNPTNKVIQPIVAKWRALRRKMQVTIKRPKNDDQRVINTGTPQVINWW